MRLALRVCRSALPRRAFHPVVSCCWRRGFYRPRGGSNVLFDIGGCFGIRGHRAAVGKVGITRKRRTLLAFQASRVLENSMICEILNYLLASLVRSSCAELGRVLVAWTPNPKPGFPMRRNIPAQRNHAVACECIGYVLNEVIGNEGNA